MLRLAMRARAANACAPLLAGLALLAGCSSDAPIPVQRIDDDPALSAALSAPLMVDPALDSQSGRDALIMVDDPPAAPVPIQPAGAAAADAARAEAVRLAGRAIPAAPDPQQVRQRRSDLSVAGAITAVQAARAAGGLARTCAGGADYGAIWAARLPPAFPVYPHGAVQEAAGTDRAGCALRAVSFTVPVPPRDVIDFYHMRATAAGYGAVYRLGDGDHLLAGRRGGAAYALGVRERGDGLTTVVLVTSGG